METGPLACLPVGVSGLLELVPVTGGFLLIAPIWPQAPRALGRWTLASQGDASSRGREGVCHQLESRPLEAGPVCFSPQIHPECLRDTCPVVLGETFTHLEILSPKKQARSKQLYSVLSIYYMPHMIHRLFFKIKN